MEQKSVRMIGSYHPITVALINKLETGKPGDTLTDEEIKRIAGIACSTTDKGNHYLQSAVRYCEKLGVIWQRQAACNKILCLNPEEVVERSRKDMGCIRRRTRRSAHRMSTIDPQSLPADKRAPALALSAQLGAIVMFSKNETTKKITASGGGQPQIEDVIRIFDK